MGHQYDLPFAHEDLSGCSNLRCKGHSMCTCCNDPISEHGKPNTPTSMQLDLLKCIDNVYQLDPIGMCTECGSYDVCKSCLRQYLVNIVDDCTYTYNEPDVKVMP